MANKKKQKSKTINPLLILLIIILTATICLKKVNKTEDNYNKDSTTSLSTDDIEKNKKIETTQNTDTKVTEESTSMQSNENLTDDEKKQYVLSHPDEYTQELIEFMNKYDQVIDYVYNYKNRDTISISANTQDSTTDTAFPLLIQWDYRWGYEQYGDSLVGTSGCGPTSLCMVYCGLTGQTNKTPYSICKMSEDNGYYVSGVGTSWDLMTKGANDIGIQSQQLSLTENNMINELAKGHPIICSMRPGDFTKGGHFIVITDYKDGKFSVNDPNSRENSRKKWTYAVLEPQIKKLWSFWI